MGDATKLAFAVFLISCSSGGCGGVFTWFIVSCGESGAMLFVTSAECSAQLGVMCAECNAIPRKGGGGGRGSPTLPFCLISGALSLHPPSSMPGCAQGGVWGLQRALEWLLVGHSNTTRVLACYENKGDIYIWVG